MKIPVQSDPLITFAAWLEEAKRAKIEEPTAFTLATVNANGAPSARLVLLKSFDDRGFVFYTNLASPKARELDANPRAALCFHWQPLRKQVRIEGVAARVSDEEADAYFATRGRDSQIGAWASKQSQPMEGRFDLEKRVAKYAATFGLGRIPRPPFWSGYRIHHERVEFWLSRPFRLHDRLLYIRTPEGWRTEILYP